jgi:hypothetical protein
MTRSIWTLLATGPICSCTRTRTGLPGSQCGFLGTKGRVHVLLVTYYVRGELDNLLSCWN